MDFDVKLLAADDLDAMMAYLSGFNNGVLGLLLMNFYF